MDTRTKIVSREEAVEIAARTPARWFTAQFDPMQAEHARMLNEIAADGHLLIVEIAGPPEPLLPARARAELAAGLDCVDYVVIGGRESSATAHDEELRRRFIERVQRRAGVKA